MQWHKSSINLHLVDDSVKVNRLVPDALLERLSKIAEIVNAGIHIAEELELAVATKVAPSALADTGQSSKKLLLRQVERDRRFDQTTNLKLL